MTTRCPRLRRPRRTRSSASRWSSRRRSGGFSARRRLTPTGRGCPSSAPTCGSSAKCARLATCIDDPPDDFGYDAAPNLLLLEVIGARVRASLDALFDDEHRPAFDAILAELGTRLEPLHDQVSDRARAEIAGRIERGEAPTPFLIVQSG